MAKKNILCPFCFEHFTNVDAYCQCTNNEIDLSGNYKCARVIDTKYCEHWGVTIESNRCFKSKKSLFASVPQPTACPECGKVSNVFVCPHCHNIIPRGMIEEGAEIISVIGAPDSGKTVFFTSLMHEMRAHSHWCKLSVTPLTEVLAPGTPTTAQKHREFEVKLFEDHGILDQTDETDKYVPLIFRLSTKKASDPKKGKTIYLVFYDTAGESFNKDVNSMRNIKYLRESSGVIILIDPYSVKKLRNDLRKCKDSEKAKDKDATKIITQLTNLKDAEGSSAMKDTYVALTFSKIDAVINGLVNNAKPNPFSELKLENNSSFLKTKKYDLEKTQLISDELIEVSRENWDLGSMYTDLTNQFDENKLCYFAVSSLGSSPDDDTVEEYTPYRVMDPLIWILHKLGGFDIPVE